MAYEVLRCKGIMAEANSVVVDEVDDSSDQKSGSELLVFFQKDPVADLNKDIIFTILSYLSPAELLRYRAVSKLWQTTIDSFATNAVFKQYYPVLGLAPRAQDTNKEANLRFRREVSYLESLGSGKARDLICLPNTAFWHINGEWIVVGAKDGFVTLLKATPGNGVDTEWKKHVVCGLARPLMDVEEVLADVIVTASGCVLVDSGPKGFQTQEGGMGVTASMFSESGHLMWKTYLGDFAGKAFVKDNTIYRIEIRKGSDKPLQLLCYFTARSVLDGAVLYQNPLPLGTPFHSHKARWLLMLLGFEKYCLLHSVSKPFDRMVILNMDSGLPLGWFSYESLGWRLIWPEKLEDLLELEIDLLIDAASPKSPGFQIGHQEIIARVCGRTLRPLLPPGYAFRRMRMSQRYHWVDDAGRTYVREIFFQLQHGIIKIRVPEAADKATRRLHDRLHCTESHPYRCVTTPSQESQQNKGAGERKVFCYEENHEGGIEENDEYNPIEYWLGYFGMAGRFLTMHRHKNSTSELYILDFQAPI